MPIDKATLLGATFAEEDVELSIGTVRVRGLSRAEVLRYQGSVRDAVEFEVQLLAAALVDPALTVDEVRELLDKIPAGVLEPLTDVIKRLSGMEPGAAKATFPGAGG